MVEVAKKNTITQDEWLAEGTKRFGEDKRNWEFVCPACGRVQSYNIIQVEMNNDAFKPKRSFPVEDGKPQVAIYSECTGPECNWVAYGLFSGPVTVILDPVKSYNEAKKDNCAMVFEFAEQAQQ